MSDRRRLRKDPRDFTGGGIFGLPRKSRSTGNKEIDAKIHELVESWACDSSNALVREMIVTALKFGRDCPPEGDLKLYNRALKEMRYSSLVFGPYADERKISIFGSARTKPDEPEYKAAVDFAEKMREAGFMAITGAGPGIMEAAQEGAGRDSSFGLNIRLPFEQGANPHIDGDEKLIN
ncbi:MAG: cytochrome D ubiquinol oxidase subunit II, partial [Verrucomicrobiota bacterium]